MGFLSMAMTPCFKKESLMAGNSSNGRGGLYMVVGALVVAVMGLGYVVLQDKANEPDLAISVSEDGIEVNGN
jgi:hypothetical protein